MAGLHKGLLNVAVWLAGALLCTGPGSQVCMARQHMKGLQDMLCLASLRSILDCLSSLMCV